MAANFYLPHVWILPEDDANRQMAVGFSLDSSVSERALDILNVARGWQNVVDTFLSVHVAKMNGCPQRFMILMVDFDRDASRLERIKAQIPAYLSRRVFVFGAWSEPEELKSSLGSFQEIGLGLARDCREGTNFVCGHELLRNNASELQRMREVLKPVVFPDF